MFNTKISNNLVNDIEFKFNIKRANNLVTNSEFMMALRYGDPLSEEVVNNLKRFITPTVTGFDEYVDEIWDFEYYLNEDEPVRMIVQHLRKPDMYMTFASIENGKYVPRFNAALRSHLELIDLVSD